MDAMSKALQNANLLGINYEAKVNKTRKKVGVVLPIMGNKRYVMGLIPTIRSKNHEVYIIAIDNGSKDGTTEELIKLKNEGTLSMKASYSYNISSSLNTPKSCLYLNLVVKL